MNVCLICFFLESCTSQKEQEIFMRHKTICTHVKYLRVEDEHLHRFLQEVKNFFLRTRCPPQNVSRRGKRWKLLLLPFFLVNRRRPYFLDPVAGQSGYSGSEFCCSAPLQPPSLTFPQIPPTLTNLSASSSSSHPLGTVWYHQCWPSAECHGHALFLSARVFEMFSPVLGLGSKGTILTNIWALT